MDYSKDEISAYDVLAKKMGKKQANTFISVMARDHQFVNAIRSVVGQEIYKDALNQAESLFYSILYEKSEKLESDKAELRAYLRILDRWNAIMDNFFEKTDHAKKLTNKKGF